MLEKTHCNICQADNYEVLIQDGLSSIVRCRNCRLVYRNPRESKEEYTQVYHSSYYTPLNKESWYKRKIDFFKRAMQNIEKRKPRGRLLDLGCGFGYFLDLAKQRGWEVYGVEISPYAGKIATGELKLNVFQGELNAAHFPDNYFDVITMWNFLDHLHDPGALLKEVRRALKPDGLVAMRMPNMDFQLPGFKLFKAVEIATNIFGIKNPFVVHIYGFSKDTLKTILQRNGFRHVEIINSRLRNRPVAVINNLFFASAELISCLSRGKIFIAPTLEAYAWS